MIPLKKVRDLISKHALLEAELSSGTIDKKNFAEKSKEYADLNNIVQEAKAYSNFENEKKEIEKIINDKDGDIEMREMAETELNDLVDYLSSEKSSFVTGSIVTIDGGYTSW